MAWVKGPHGALTPLPDGVAERICSDPRRGYVIVPDPHSVGSGEVESGPEVVADEALKPPPKRRGRPPTKKKTT